MQRAVHSQDKVPEMSQELDKFRVSSCRPGAAAMHFGLDMGDDCC